MNSVHKERREVGGGRERVVKGRIMIWDTAVIRILVEEAVLELQDESNGHTSRDQGTRTTFKQTDRGKDSAFMGHCSRIQARQGLGRLPFPCFPNPSKQGDMQASGFDPAETRQMPVAPWQTTSLSFRRPHGREGGGGVEKEDLAKQRCF